MKEKWTLIHRITGHRVDYSLDRFNTLEQFCKLMIEDGMDIYYQIQYFQDGKLIETVDITDYFN